MQWVQWVQGVQWVQWGAEGAVVCSECIVCIVCSVCSVCKSYLRCVEARLALFRAKEWSPHSCHTVLCHRPTAEAASEAAVTDNERVVDECSGAHFLSWREAGEVREEDPTL